MRILIVLALLTVTGCVSHTAVINCSAKNFDDCARVQLGKNVKVTRATHIDGDMYMVDYRD